MVLNVGDWWTEASYTMPFATNMKCFNLVCDIENISKHEDYFGKEHWVYHRTKITGEWQNVGDGMSLESPPEFTLPVCIGRGSHLGPLVFELSWPFSGEKTDEAFYFLWDFCDVPTQTPLAKPNISNRDLDPSVRAEIG